MAAALDPILARLAALHPRVIDLSLDRVLRLLADLGHPERGLPPTVHIAGTNGKGSLLAYLRDTLRIAGYRVHAYSSPHLVRMAERYHLAGQMIDDARLVDFLERAESANDGRPITLFEIETVAGFLAFAEVPADILILETGLGGRLDATNVLERPALTALTPISMDHQQYLGDSLTGIAAEKAAILKPGVAGVIGRQMPSVASVIEARAEQVAAPLFRFDREWTVRVAGDRIIYESEAGRRDLPLPGLTGSFQVENAGLAVACLERLEGFPIGEAVLAEGLRETRWPARMQRLSPGPLRDSLPEGWELWLDGGHNPAAGEVIASTLAGWERRPLHIVTGMLTSKEPEPFLKPLVPFADSLTAIAIPDETNSFAADAMADHARAAGMAEVAVAAGPAEALRAIAARVPDEPPARVLICGSLYLAGHILAANLEAPK